MLSICLSVCHQNVYKNVIFSETKQFSARFYELGLTRELTNPRVGVIPSVFSD